jgi:hypothetical protein
MCPIYHHVYVDDVSRDGHYILLDFVVLSRKGLTGQRILQVKFGFEDC